MYVNVLKMTATFLMGVSRELKLFHTRKLVCVFINIEKCNCSDSNGSMGIIYVLTKQNLF